MDDIESVENHVEINTSSALFAPIHIDSSTSERPAPKFSRQKRTCSIVYSSTDTEDESLLALVATGEETAPFSRSNRSKSPPPKCAICLGRCKNKCFTDSCMHQFCFKCLCEWSKVKPECPLCKENFKSIIHNIRSINQFEEYHVEQEIGLQVHPPTAPNIVQSTNAVHRNQSRSSIELALSNPSLRRLTHRDNTGSREHAFDRIQTHRNGANDYLTNFVDLSNVNTLENYSESFLNGDNGTLGQLWRRYIYDRKLYANPVCDINGRFRESSAYFYRNNPSQIFRLMTWIHRDIISLMNNMENDITPILDNIKEWLTSFNMLSRQFRRCLQPLLGSKTVHFIHELNNFARSPFDMIGYDREVQYSLQHVELTISSSSSDSSSASTTEIMNQTSASNENTEFATESSNAFSEIQFGFLPTEGQQTSNHRSLRVTSRRHDPVTLEYDRPPLINLYSFTISTISHRNEGIRNSGNSFADRSSPNAAINLSMHNRINNLIINLDVDEDVNRNDVQQDLAEPIEDPSYESLTNLSPTVIPECIDLSSSSSDECEFVLERKPPHLRTPELVSLNSDSDSDVVFVEATNQTNSKTSVSQTSNQTAKFIDGSNTFHEDNVGASTSSGISGFVGDVKVNTTEGRMNQDGSDMSESENEDLYKYIPNHERSTGFKLKKKFKNQSKTLRVSKHKKFETKYVLKKKGIRKQCTSYRKKYRKTGKRAKKCFFENDKSQTPSEETNMN